MQELMQQKMYTILASNTRSSKMSDMSNLKTKPLEALIN
ncbi:hypothetical protein Niako_4790 [Niastella koreensis GR20-10]|uniref:Uncharacterized protein n=1 Tax=Niastella koreensis (strain DSM 17620 / KACC 11465 / NBRC 106392 / GR20-10) TaxID=700598 RepID=G8TQ39_NIAKG|nr:hypothetical protein Niako_4790 [Niastella koreensis GR20-10]